LYQFINNISEVVVIHLLYLKFLIVLEYAKETNITWVKIFMMCRVHVMIIISFASYSSEISGRVIFINYLLGECLENSQYGKIS